MKLTLYFPLFTLGNLCIYIPGKVVYKPKIAFDEIRPNINYLETMVTLKDEDINGYNLGVHEVRINRGEGEG